MSSFHYKNPREHIRFAKLLRKQAPKPEQLLWTALSQLKKETGFKFRRQHPLKPYIADFACITARLIVELDGMSHDSHQVYDEKRTMYLHKLGWTVIRFSNHEIQKNIDGVILTIIEKVKELSKVG